MALYAKFKELEREGHFDAAHQVLNERDFPGVIYELDFKARQKVEKKNLPTIERGMAERRTLRGLVLEKIHQLDRKARTKKRLGKHR